MDLRRINIWCKYLYSAHLILLTLLVISSNINPTHQQDSPSSTQNVITYEILEEQQPNTLIGNIITDAKLDSQYSQDILDQLRYNFLTQSSIYREHFVIEERTGLFRTQKTLDRDVMCTSENIENNGECWIRLDVAVQPVQYFQIIKISVLVIDLNDNFPTFPESRISLSISETTVAGASFAIPRAEDADSGLYGVQSYHLVTSDSTKFELRTNGDGSDENSDLQLVLKDKLDRETKDAYILKIVAKDGGIPQKTGAIMVDVTVADANDNNPQFVNHTYTTYVYENIPSGSVVVTVTAKDMDIGENGEIFYDFSRASKNLYGYLFEINSFTGEIFVKDSINYEDNKEFTLGVVAKDKGPNALSDYAKVVIHVWDVNDHAPQITINAMSESGVAQVEEGSEDGTFVAHISVLDRDGGQNGEFTCTLDHPSFQLVQLFSTEYKIISTQVFDREVQDQYSMTIICQDKGTNPQTSSQELQVEITDVNDHAPVFISDFYAVSLRENNAIGEYLTQVNASDADIGNNSDIIYSVKGEHINMIRINSKSGMILSNHKFDFEIQSEYKYTVIAIDRGTPSLSATAILTITVLDINDNVPKFPQKSYTFGTFENQASGTEIGTMEAFDLDTAPYDSIIYSFDFTQGDVGTFKIDPYSGKITTRKVLDREEKDTYKLVVLARNDGHLSKSTANVTVYIADQNDNPPVILFPTETNNTVQVSAFATKNDPVSFVEAYDNDIANNAQLTFSVLGGSGQDLFGINAFTGQIFVVDALNTYSGQTLQLTVLVQDKGESPLSSLADLYIHINSSLAPISSSLSSLNSNDLSETNLVIIICLSIVAVVLLVFVLLIVLLFRRCQNRLGNSGSRDHTSHKPTCMCKQCRVAKYVQYEQSERIAQTGNNYSKDSTYIHADNIANEAFAADNGGFTNGNAVYLKMETKDPNIELKSKKPSIFETVFGGKSKSGSDANGSLNKKHKVHFAEQAPNPAYQPVSNSSSSSPSKTPDHIPTCPDLLQGGLDADQKNWKPQVDEGRKRLLYRGQNPHCNNGTAMNGQKYLMPLQVQSLLNTTPPDDGSDHGSSCDSGRGPSEEEQDHSRHSNTISDAYLFPTPGNNPLTPPDPNMDPSLPNPALQHVHCSCKPSDPSTHRDSMKSYNGSKRYPCKHSHPKREQSSNSNNNNRPNLESPRHTVWSTHNSPIRDSSSIPRGRRKAQPIPPRRSPAGVISSKPLPELPCRDNESADGDSEGESTTTSGSYMVDAILDLSTDGPQISPCDVYV